MTIYDMICFRSLRENVNRNLRDNTIDDMTSTGWVTGTKVEISAKVNGMNGDEEGEPRVRSPDTRKRERNGVRRTSNVVIHQVDTLQGCHIIP